MKTLMFIWIVCLSIVLAPSCSIAGKDGDIARLTIDTNKNNYSSYSYETGLLILNQVKVENEFYQIHFQQQNDETFRIIFAEPVEHTKSRSYCNWKSWKNGSKLSCHLISIENSDFIFEYSQIFKSGENFIVEYHD